MIYHTYDFYQDFEVFGQSFDAQITVEYYMDGDDVEMEAVWLYMDGNLAYKGYRSLPGRVRDWLVKRSQLETLRHEFGKHIESFKDS